MFSIVIQTNKSVEKLKTNLLKYLSVITRYFQYSYTSICMFTLSIYVLINITSGV